VFYVAAMGVSVVETLQVERSKLATVRELKTL